MKKTDQKSAATYKPYISQHMEVDFHDVDSYRIVWHGNYPKYFEIARCKLLEHINFTYRDMEDAGYFFPIIDIKIKYIKPLYFGQKFIISATLQEWETKLTISYILEDSETGEKLTQGETSQVAVAMPDRITQFTSPQVLVDKVKAALNV